MITALVAGLAASTQAAADEPVRVTVVPNRAAIESGEAVGIEVGLRDATGRATVADRALDVDLFVGDTAKPIKVRLEQGEKAAVVEIDTGPPGLLELQAEHPELRPGGAFVQVKPAKETIDSARDESRTLLIMGADRWVEPSAAERVEGTGSGRAKARGDSREEERGTEELSPGQPARGPMGPSRRGTDREDLPAPIFEPAIEVMGRTAATDDRRRSEVMVFEVPSPESGPPVPENRESATRIWLRAAPRTGVLANREDYSEISAMVQGATRTPLKVHLSATTGRLDPPSLVLQPGDSDAKAKLTSARPGRVTVEYLGADPQVELMDDKPVVVDFEPPITSLKLGVPEESTIGEPVEVVAQLVGHDEKTIATSSPRKVSFSVKKGRAKLTGGPWTIQPDEFEVRASLTGHWWGTAKIEAASPNLRTQSATVKVIFPLDILALTCLGSLAGGFIAWSYGRNKREWLWQRLLTGLVAGLVLYWLLLFLGTTPRAALNNPFGVFAAAVIGGWLGTEVFDLAARHLGLRKGPQAAGGGGSPGGR